MLQLADTRIVQLETLESQDVLNVLQAWAEQDISVFGLMATVDERYGPMGGVYYVGDAWEAALEVAQTLEVESEAVTAVVLWDDEGDYPGFLHEITQRLMSVRTRAMLMGSAHGLVIAGMELDQVKEVLMAH